MCLVGLGAVLCVLILMGLAACSSNPPSTRSVPSPTEIVQLPELGPLAVMANRGGSDAGGGTGTVRIDEDCVTLMFENGYARLLLWHLADITWDEQRQEISYTSPRYAGADPITIRDGDIISVGGEALESDQPVERNLTWVATPNATCVDDPWIVDSLTKP